MTHDTGLARIAVIGTGMMGALHAERVASAANAQLALLCSIDDQAQSLAERLGVALLADYRDIISKDVDGVIIATPNRLHHPNQVDRKGGSQTSTPFRLREKVLG